MTSAAVGFKLTSMCARARLLLGVSLLVNACSGTADQGGAPDSSAEAETWGPCVSGSGSSTLMTVPIATQPAVDGSDLILAASNALLRVPLAGGEPETLVEARSPSAPIVLASQAYFSAEMLVGATDANGKQMSGQGLFAVPLAGGEPGYLPELGNFAPVAEDGAALYVDTHGRGFERWDPKSDALVELRVDTGLLVDAVAVYGDFVYVAAQDITRGGGDNGVIGRIPKLGGDFEALITGLGHPWNLVASAAGLFWNEDPPTLTGGQTGRVARSALDGRDIATVASGSATSLLYAHGRLFAALGGEIDSFPVKGGDPVVVASGLAVPGMLTVVGGNLVWIDPVYKALSSTEPTHVMTACAAPPAP